MYNANFKGCCNTTWVYGKEGEKREKRHLQNMKPYTRRQAGGDQWAGQHFSKVNLGAEINVNTDTADGKVYTYMHYIKCMNSHAVLS
jgi:hypothetical protein